MPDRAVLPTYEQFAEGVQDALNNLYDTPYLQNHALAAWLVDPQTRGLQRGQEARRRLVNALRAMRPGPGVPAQSPDWRMYRILELRYLEGLSPQKVMERVSLAKSQYYREQGRILELVTDLLWGQAQEKLAERAAFEMEFQEEDTLTRDVLARSEVERLCANADWQDINIGDLVTELCDVIAPLALDKKVVISVGAVRNLVVPSADWVMLRQVLVNVVTQAVEVAQGGKVVIDRLDPRQGIGVRVLASSTRSAPPASIARQGLGLDICRQFMAAMGGALIVETQQNARWEAQLVWYAHPTPVLLVVDDNEYFHDLFGRYLSGYNWHVVGAASAVAANQKIAEIKPTVILLDVMMPKQDGWAFLRALRAAEETNTIPVIVCSVLNQPQLAHSLGATGYLLKPVTQPALLQALSPWCEESATLPQAYPAQPRASELLLPTQTPLSG